MKNVDLFASTEFRPEDLQKTIRQLWDATKPGEAIRCPEYLEFCDVLEKLMRIDFPTLARSFPYLWNFTPAEASKVVRHWAEKERARNPEYLSEIIDTQRAWLKE